MKEHNLNEEIEIRLHNHVSTYYHLQYRYKNPITLWEKIFGCRWYEPYLYHDYVTSTSDDPDKYWFSLSYDARDVDLVEMITKLKQSIKTTKDFRDYFEIDKRNTKYYERLKSYKNWYNKTYRLGNNIK